VKLWKIVTRGYVALGTEVDSATQADADQYDTDPYGYVDLAVQRLRIDSQESTYVFSNEEDALAVAEYITTPECADCFGVAVRYAEVVEVVEDAVSVQEILQQFISGQISDETARVRIKEIDPDFDFDAWMTED
jgi:translation initiation factor RLI1